MAGELDEHAHLASCLMRADEYERNFAAVVSHPAATTWTWAWRSYRVRQWWYFALLPAGRLHVDALWLSPGPTLLRLAGGIGLAALILAHAYGLNAWADRATDLDRRKNPLMSQQISPALRWAIALPAMLALGLAPLGGWPTTAAVVLALAGSMVYSAGPRWKAVPGLGTCLNAAIFAPLLVLAPLSTQPDSLLLWLLVFLGLLLQNQLLHELADVQEDRRAGVQTTALSLGPRATRWLAAGCGISVALAVPWLAPDPATARIGIAVLIATSAMAASPVANPARRRRQHGDASLLGGALLWLAGQG